MTSPKRLFVTGTDTGIGKTVVSAILTVGLNASYWKPIQSGITPDTDTEWVARTTCIHVSRLLPEAYRLKTPVSPHLAAKLDNVSIDLDLINLPALPNSDSLVVEGAGGLMVPLNDKYLIIDLIKKLSIPVVLVSRTSLGTINHTLLSLQMLRQYQIPIMGVVLNGKKNEDNKKAIEHYGRVKILAELEPLTELNQQSLQNAYIQHFREFN